MRTATIVLLLLIWAVARYSVGYSDGRGVTTTGGGCVTTTGGGCVTTVGVAVWSMVL